MPVESGMLKRLKDLIKADQVKITKEEVDWKDIVESLCKKNKKWKATVVPLSQNFSIDDIKDNDEWVSFYTKISVLCCVLGHSTNSYCLQ